MENSTLSTKQNFNFNFGRHIVDMTFIIVCGIVSIYLFIALVYHELKVEKRPESFIKASTEKRLGLVYKYICIFIGFSSIIANFILVINCEISKEIAVSNTQHDTHLKVIGQNGVVVCNVLGKIHISVISVSTGFVYLFLWFRQRVFYIHPSLKQLNNCFSKTLSFAIIFAWSVYFASMFLVLLIELSYELQDGVGCTLSDSSLTTYHVLLISWLCASIMMQIGLLCLFIFPICKKLSWNVDTSSQNIILFQRVKKAIILALICLVSDIISAVLEFVFTREDENDLAFFYPVNIIINHVATIMCFDYWKTLLWPWKKNCFHSCSMIATSEAVENETISTLEKSQIKQNISSAATF